MSESPKSGPQGRVDVKSRRTLSKNKPRASTCTNVKRGAVGHVASDNVINKGDVLDLFVSEEDEASEFEGFAPSVEYIERHDSSTAGKCCMQCRKPCRRKAARFRRAPCTLTPEFTVLLNAIQSLGDNIYRPAAAHVDNDAEFNQSY
jgi:hypothetical protein